MRACRTGDLDLVKQSLANRSGGLNDRTSCTGKTPLLLAIEKNQLNIVRFLLDQGADPTMGDDDQIHYPQLPPAWAHWLEVLKLLVKKGASIHEAFHDRPLGTFDIFRDNAESKQLEFLRFLHEESCADFNVCYYARASWSALQTAVRAKAGAVEGLAMLANWGADLSIIFHDGRTMLHMAAELAIEPGVVTFLSSRDAAYTSTSKINGGGHRFITLSSQNDTVALRLHSKKRRLP
ncbi:ankyrin repeat-containing domain protein [Lophiotrema nucula]|uniref:Ankyrin repeat-containing domain protein n=1 Tax=Lophiotrema nucula TaxID=690887 RepID=A0A6A5YMZ5_9PLEO|nr:ankyrin repeat-containing domain protein [Lophiotrema nucula]